MIEKLKHLVDEVGALQSKLVLLIGPPHSGKTALLHALAQSKGVTPLNVAAALGYPTFDPHGDPIPSKEGNFVQADWRPLTTLTTGMVARVSRILHDDNKEMLRHLAALGLIPGAKITIAEISPLADLITFIIQGEKRAIGQAAAACVLVTPIPAE